MTDWLTKFFSLFVCGILFITSCDREQEEEVCEDESIALIPLDVDSLSNDSISRDETNIEIEEHCDLEDYLIEMGLIDVGEVNDNIMVDLRYSSTNNFLSQNMYGCLNKAYLQPEVAERLSSVQDYLTENYPHLHLYIFDAVRPVSVQQKMWDALDSIPVSARIKFVSNPKNGSIHNYGAAIDLSIYDKNQDTLLDMGAGFDDMRLIAYPKFEEKFFEEGKLTAKHIENRKLLRKAMNVGGFWELTTEWWHFNAYSRDKAKLLFEPIDFTEEEQ